VGGTEGDPVGSSEGSSVGDRVHFTGIDSDWFA